MAEALRPALVLSLAFSQILGQVAPSATAAPRAPAGFGIPSGARAPATVPSPGGDSRLDGSLPSSRQGRLLRINGQEQRATWLLSEPSGTEAQLWLPLEVLQGQLGFSSRSLADGSLELEWYGRTLQVPAARQRSLEDEVAIEVGGLLRANGVGLEVLGGTLTLTLAPPQLVQVRSSRPGGPRRIVLDLDGPALVRSDGGALEIAVRSGAAPLQTLRELGLNSQLGDGRLSLPLTGVAQGARVFTVGDPPRVVIDLAAAGQSGSTGAGTGATGSVPPPLDPRLQSLLGDSVVWERRVLPLGAGSVRLNAVSIDPRSAPVELRPLRRDDGMEGLSLLPHLARRWDALVAINGGYFNRVRRLPLGALREEGRWLSGPILNRGALGWRSGELPRFGRLQLRETLIDRSGGRWPLTVLNSGYVQRGLSRYTADWGPWYRSLSNGESAVLVRAGIVVARYGSAQLAAGVPLRGADLLVVGRGGSEPPWSEGEPLQLESGPSDPLGTAPNVIGGGPLLLQDGRNVLQGAAEGFSPAFLSQGAPRTVVASDGRRLRLLTLQGIDQPGPTLAETAVLLQRLGLRDALNLDGGSSTGLVMGGNHAVKGRGVAAAIHNGLGLVLRQGALPRPGAWDGVVDRGGTGSDSGS
ncbi:MAG: phosphodiester glycosidase family protein [Cyanobium sp.]